PRTRPLSDARDLAGRALVRNPVRARPAGDVHQPPRRDGSARQPADDDRRRGGRRGADLGPEPVPPGPDLRADRLGRAGRGRPDGHHRYQRAPSAPRTKNPMTQTASRINAIHSKSFAAAIPTPPRMRIRSRITRMSATRSPSARWTRGILGYPSRLPI